MTKVRNLLTTGAVAALVGIGAFAATITAADARVACNRFGECWHVTDTYDYPATLGVRFYDDNWYANHHWRNGRWGNYHWRGDHDGRGYWRNGIWITL